MKKINKKKILFITERRADYSRLKPIMRLINKSKKLEMLLVTTGVHLLKEFGETKKVIEQDGFHIDATLPMFSKDDSDDGVSMVKAFGHCIIGLADIFEKLKPDMIFCGFDIGAHLAAAIVGMHMNIPVAHIQGGERSGTIDEVIRHAMTKFSHIHFVATKESRDRIIKLGEIPQNVFLVGSPSLDTIKSIKYPPKNDIYIKYGLDLKKKTIVFMQHPVTTEINDINNHIEISISAIENLEKKYNIQVLAIYPNNDAGGKRIVTRLNKSNFKVYSHIIYEDFLRILKYADVLVGNSSTGIHETASFGLPTVNIGTRQQFRERAGNIIDVLNKKEDIIEAIDKCLNDKLFIKKIRGCSNPYDNGNTANQVVKILENIVMPPIQKVITY